MFINPQIQPIFEKVRLKHKKFNTLTRSNKVVGHSLAIGQPGHGKTTGNRKEAELRYELNHKIIALYDAGRMDLALFSFPSDSKFWKCPKIEKGKIITSKPYKTELLYPMTKSLKKKEKLPMNGKAFTIGVSDLDEDDISALTGSSSLESLKDILNTMETKVNDKTTPNDYLNTLSELLKKSEDQDNIKVSHHGAKPIKGKVFLPLINQGILSSKSANTTINLKEILKDKKTISVLVLKHCPQKLWGFLVHYFMNHCYKLLSGVDGSDRIIQNTTIMLNEVQDLLEEESDFGESSLAISRSISKILRQSRTANVFLLMDTQLPQKLPDVKDIMQRVYVYNSGFPEVQKVCEMMGITRGTGMLNSDEMSLIPFLPPGWYFLLDRQKGVSFHKLAWLRSKTYNAGEEFYDVYEKYKGRGAYYSIAKEIQELKEEEELSKKKWKLKRKEKVELKDDDYSLMNDSLEED